MDEPRELLSNEARAARLQQRALEPKQPFLALEPAAVAGEAPACADDAVAREDDRDRVPVHHGADGPRRLRRADLCRESAVRRRVAVLDPREFREHALVELG